MSNPPPCHKKSYETRALAKKARRELNRLDKFKGKPLTNIYYCPRCSGYHLTSANKKSSRDFTKRLNRKNRRA